jgi:hypothetical protein
MKSFWTPKTERQSLGHGQERDSRETEAETSAQVDNVGSNSYKHEEGSNSDEHEEGSNINEEEGSANQRYLFQETKRGWWANG